MTRTWLTFLTKTFQVFQWSSTQWISELQWGVTIATAALPSLPYHRFPLTLPLSNASHDIPTGTKTKIVEILCEYLVARWTQAMSSDRSHTVCPTCKYAMWQACIFPDQRIGTPWPAATAWYRPIQLVHGLYTGTGHCNRHWQYTVALERTSTLPCRRETDGSDWRKPTGGFPPFFQWKPFILEIWIKVFKKLKLTELNRWFLSMLWSTLSMKTFKCCQKCLSTKVWCNIVLTAKLKCTVIHSLFGLKYACFNWILKL